MATKDVLKHGENYVPTINDNASSSFGAYETYSRDKLDEKLGQVAVSAGYDWSGKKIVFEGESITMNGTMRYPEYVAEQTGCTAVKIGLAGVPVYGNYPGQGKDFRRRVSNIPADADAIIIMGDVNAGPPATITEPFTTDITKWGGRWNVTVDAIKRSFPTVPVFLVSEYVMSKHSPGTAEQFRKTSHMYGAHPVILAEESPLNLRYAGKQVWGLSATDGVHCNHAAMPLFADVIIRHLKQVPPFEWSGSDTLTLNTTELSVAVDATADIEYSITGDLSIQWTSDNQDVACVMGGKVYGMTAGTATITATTRNGNKATCTVTVTE